MKYEIYFTPTFKKKLKNFLKKYPELEIEIEKKLEILSSDPFHPVLKIHKLSGKLKNEWSIWLTYEYRILLIIEGNKIFLTNIGVHDEVY